MSAVANNLLDGAMRLGGVLAAAVIGVNRQVLTRSHSPALSEPELAPVWRHLADAMDVGAHHRLAAQQMRWIFERVLVYCVRRADGLLLALIVGRGSGGTFDAAAAELLFEEFRRARDA